MYYGKKQVPQFSLDIFRFYYEVVPRQSDLLHVLKVKTEDNGCVVFNI